MTRFVSTYLLALCVCVTCAFDNCGEPPQSGTSGGGFPVTTNTTLVTASGSPVTTISTPGISVSGYWLSDDSGAAGSQKSFTLITDSNGNGFVGSGRVNSNWNSTVFWEPPCGDISQQSSYVMNVSPITGIPWVCLTEIQTIGDDTSTHFVLPAGVPSTLTAYGNFSTTYGMPKLFVDSDTPPSQVSSVSATSVTAGTSATFPFPKQSNGTALGMGFYGIMTANISQEGYAVEASPSYLAVGGTTSLAGAFGVDAANVTNTTTLCNPRCTQLGSYTWVVPFVTQYYADQIIRASDNFQASETIPVGSEPVAIKTYGTYTDTWLSGSYIYKAVGPANAVVVNSGSNSVSVVSFSTKSTVANIAVGAHPMAVALNSNATMAYVANYGSGTLSEINLSTNALTRTASGVTGAQSVAMDPSSSYVWVGGTNYLYKVSLSNFTITSSQPMAGSVTSLAASNALGELVYTLVQNCCSPSSSYVANEMLLSNMSQTGTYGAASANPYAAFTMNGTLPSAAVVPHASAVSAQFANGMAASATPTGFVVYDLVSHQQLMTGSTPTPVRGIASDPQGMYAYFTLPDSNEYISVPLESAP